jgi:LPS export ABC transporter permease LptG/LPS export ABC transporter permease LptF
MLTILDRYVLRQLAAPFGLGLLIFTFPLIIPEFMRYAEKYFAKGVSLIVVGQLIAALLPYSLTLTIPMSLLLALLIAFGRLSTDREFVALQACGVSLWQLLRPVILVSVLATAATAWVYMELIPVGNQAFRQITFNIVASSAENEVKPRVFFEGFPNIVLYARELPSTGGWEGVFIADNRGGEGTSVFNARRGRAVVNRNARTVELVLEDWTRHTLEAKGNYAVARSRPGEQLVFNVNPEGMFPSGGLPKGLREMSVPELKARIAELRDSSQPIDNQALASATFEFHKRFSIPAACFVMGLVGIALGATNRRDARMTGLVLGVAVIFLYYLLLFFGQSTVRGGRLAPWLAAWLPNLVLGAAGIVLFKWRDRMVDRAPIPIPEAIRRRLAAGTRVLGGGWLPFGVLDRYLGATYLRIVCLSVLALVGLFYISTFVEMSEKVFKGNGSWSMLVAFAFFKTPDFLYYVVPMAVLLASLVTIALLTKNSELVVMKACGISLYRLALPLLAGAVVAGALLFVLEQTVLGPANRQAEMRKHILNGGTLETFDVLNRRWVVGRDGTIYHYGNFNPQAGHFSGLWVYEFDANMQHLTGRTFAEEATYSGDSWNLQRGWTREFDDRAVERNFSRFALARRELEPPAHFSTEPPDPEFMSITQLRAYTRQLAESGFDVVKQQVALQRKISFPFVTIVMTLIAVPFAVTIGRSGAMAGIGVGIALALVYWTAIQLFAAMGAGGLLSPVLAAWAPNLLFGSAAVYLVLTVRT